MSGQVISSDSVIRASASSVRVDRLNRTSAERFDVIAMPERRSSATCLEERSGVFSGSHGSVWHEDPITPDSLVSPKR
jgi:hypothetical protein